MNRRSLFGAFAGLLVTPVAAAAAKILPAATPSISGTATLGELVADGSIVPNNIASGAITCSKLSAASIRAIRANKLPLHTPAVNEISITDLSLDTYGNRTASEDTLIVAHDIVT